MSGARWLRYCRPVLPALMRNSSFSSKSAGWPFVQIRNVLAGSGFAAVVSPISRPPSAR